MKWKKYTIETTTAAEDFMSSMLMDLGIEGIEIEDNIPLTKEDQADMFIDFLPELPPDEGISHVSFYVEEDGSDQTEILKQVKIGLEKLRDMVEVGSGVITSSETEDLDWINNWKKYFTSFTIDDILIKPTWEELKEEDKDKFLIEIDREFLSEQENMKRHSFASGSYRNMWKENIRKYWMWDVAVEFYRLWH